MLIVCVFTNANHLTQIRGELKEQIRFFIFIVTIRLWKEERPCTVIFLLSAFNRSKSHTSNYLPFKCSCWDGGNINVFGKEKELQSPLSLWAMGFRLS